MPSPSYYFTLFKKFQVINHVPGGTVHGSGTPTGNYDLRNPNTAIGSSNRGNVLGPTNTPADSPLWRILNSRAMGNPGFTPVNVGGVNWPTMPTALGPAWTDFQETPTSPNKLVDVFGRWITEGKINDTPTDVLSTVPAPIVDGLDSGVSLFVCSVAGDNGTRPGTVPSNFWAHSLIFLVDPNTGATVTPSQLSSSGNFNLVAVVGNRGDAGAGRFNAPAAVKVEAAAWVLVFNSGASPAVQLPALSNLDTNSTNGFYEVFAIGAGRYEVVGFRLEVQTVFDGLVRAISESGIDLGGFPPEIWLQGQGAHLCAKVLVRQETESWPLIGDTPFTNRRLGQKNLVPFSIDVTVTTPDPNIVWRNFMAGDVIRFMAHMARFDREWGQNKFEIRNTLPADAARLLLAIPAKSFKRWFRAAAIEGFKEIVPSPEWKLPFGDCVVLELVSDKNEIRIPALGEEYLAMSLGIEYSIKRLKIGDIGAVTVTQFTVVPIVNEDKCYKNDYVIVGGFTIQVQTHDPRVFLKRKKQK
jgi:hypothetical protein